MNKHFGVTSGSNLRCRGWRQEGLLRLLENVLAVGEDPANLVVFASHMPPLTGWLREFALPSALASRSAPPRRQTFYLSFTI